MNQERILDEVKEIGLQVVNLIELESKIAGLQQELVSCQKQRDELLMKLKPEFLQDLKAIAENRLKKLK